MEAVRDALAVVARELHAEDTAAVARRVVGIASGLPGVRGAAVLVGDETVAEAPGEGTITVAFSDEGATVRVAGEGAMAEVELVGPILAALVAQTARREADRADRRKLTHDLRGSLAVISGQCEMLETGIWGDPTPEQTRSIAAIGRQVERMGALLDRLRDAVSR